MLFTSNAFAIDLTFLDSPQLSAPLCLEEDLYEQCAVDLCGTPENVKSPVIDSSNLKSYLSPEGTKQLPQVEKKLRSLLSNKIKEHEAILKNLQDKKASGTLIPNFKKLSPAQWQELAINVYLTQLGFNPMMYSDGDEIKSKFKVHASVTKGLKDFTLGDGFCSTQVCRKGIEDYLVNDQYGRKLEELRLKLSNPSLIEERLEKCLSKYASTVLKNNQEAKFKSIFEKSLEHYISTALSGYSDHSKAVFRNYIKDEVEIQFVKDEKHSLTSSEYLKNLNDLNSNPAKSPEASNLNVMSKYMNSSNEIDPLIDISPVCPAKYSNSAGDHYVSSGSGKAGALQVSLATQLDPESRMGVVYHELTHALSDLFVQGKLSESSKTDFLKKRACVRSLSPMDTGLDKEDEPIDGQDHKCTEEDFADVHSFRALASEDSPLLKCNLLEQSDDHTSFENVTMKSRNGHSAHLVRILNEAVHRNRKIPESCQSVMKQHKLEYNFKKCF